jgi:hypothetical protein
MRQEARAENADAAGGSRTERDSTDDGWSGAQMLGSTA